MSKDTFYFSHDYNTRTDPKIKKLLAKHGMMGYGIFWALIEDLYNNANALPTDYDCIAFDMRADKDVLVSVINDFDLFIINDGIYSSRSVETRLGKRDEKSEKARISAKVRWEKNANALRTHSDRNAIKESKVKDSKVNGYVRPKGLSASRDESIERKKEIIEEYKEFRKQYDGTDKVKAWVGLKQFISENKPEFPEPFVDAWNLFASSYKLSQVDSISDKRRKKIISRIQEPSFDFMKVLEKIKLSSHLKGDNKAGWKVTFDWVIENDNNFLKILEEQYS